LEEFLGDDGGGNADRILGIMADRHEFTLDQNQNDAWRSEIDILKQQLQGTDPGHVIFEYSIPRMGRRADVILICLDVVFVLEFKTGEKRYLQNDVDQCVDYALDLKYFHEASHDAKIVPVLVATDAPRPDNDRHQEGDDGVFLPVRANRHTVGDTIRDILRTHASCADRINPESWQSSRYRPTPTIIEAAQALYAKHTVEDISRSDAGAANLTRTTEAINRIIDESKAGGKKSICFVTGVPGAGKTLAGINLANKRHDIAEDEHAVFLSGNGPLVCVLQEALARDRVGNKNLERITKGKARQETKAFIQNIHFFRDDAIQDESPPPERVVIFDEAQRAWNREQTSSFMARKKGIKDFDMSEPQFLISVLDRHEGWAVIVCLVGGGQEINTGEAGLTEWFRSIAEHHRDWNVYISTRIADAEYARGRDMGELAAGTRCTSVPDLHLGTSLRSFRSEHVSEFVRLLLDCNSEDARSVLDDLDRYPIVMTRDFGRAKQWLREKARGTERFGIVASAKSYRLKPHGIYVELTVDATKWFLNTRDDPRSSYSLEYAATEFDVQGLELDWACVAWDANLRYGGAGDWTYREFRGTRWTHIRKDDRMTYLKNAYRVLLTRARQGLVIFLPHGDANDHTRLPEFYDRTYEYLRGLGIPELESRSRSVPQKN